jgi:hypothetical protein
VKLFVQIPCFNEEATLPLVVRSIPAPFQVLPRYASWSSTMARPTGSGPHATAARVGEAGVNVRNRGGERPPAPGLGQEQQSAANR